jgi:hypothetical protein
MSFAKEVFEKLSSKDISAHIERKMNLSYLSWAWAWSELMREYPESEYVFKPPIFFADESCEVWVTVHVSEGEKTCKHDMWLPVMDHKNNAIKNPNSRQISDARMRCLVKCIAMFGLGMSLYAGEDLPSESSTVVVEDKDWLNKGSENLKNVIAAISIGEKTMADAMQKYKISKEVQEIIKRGGE